LSERASCKATDCSDMFAIRIRFHTQMQPLDYGFVVDDLRFYLHKLELLGSDGQVFSIHLDSSSTNRGIALVDLSRDSTAVINGWVSGDARSENIHSLGFTLGVPFASNHANPLHAEKPLNESSMYWVWQQGYKFFKLDIRALSGQDFSFHMGSAGCESASALRPPSLNCSYPNRARIVLGVPDLQNLVVGVDPWLVLTTMQEQQVQLCSAASNFSDKCSYVLELFGIDPLTGLCLDKCSAQKLFSRHIDVPVDV